MLEPNEIVAVSLRGWEWKKITGSAQEILIDNWVVHGFFILYMQKGKKNLQKSLVTEKKYL